MTNPRQPDYKIMDLSPSARVANKSIREVRSLLGMPEVTEQEVLCRRTHSLARNLHAQRCETKFISTFIGGRRVEFYCDRCRAMVKE